MDQPTPKVTRADVERIVRRDFPENAFEYALRILDEYGTDDYHREKDRVQIAVLKLAAGDLEKLRREIEEAKCDYRDVLAPAEYPGYKWDRDKLPANQQQKIIDADWKQYSDWLGR